MSAKQFLAGAVVFLSLAASQAVAGDGYRPYFGPDPYYGPAVPPYLYRAPLPGYGYYSNDFDSESVRRIKASHSRYRYYSHPQSRFNSPPSQADYYGWER